MFHKILAPLAGQVIDIQIKVGDTVEEDDNALVIEAMKMETSVYIPCDGTVKEINVSVGDEVEDDDILAIIED